MDFVATPTETSQHNYNFELNTPKTKPGQAALEYLYRGLQAGQGRSPLLRDNNRETTDKGASTGCHDHKSTKFALTTETQ